MTPEPSRPPIFDERNRPFWEATRRFLIWLLRELDKWYGWKTDPFLLEEDRQ